MAAGALTVTSMAFAIVAVVLRLGHDRRLRRWDRLVATWEPHMLDALGGSGTASEALSETVREGQAPEFLSFLMTYVRRLRGEEQSMVRAMADPYLPALLPLLRTGTAESRGNAVMLLTRMGLPRYADEVARALTDESPVVSMIAARSLFRPEHERHFPELFAHLPRFAGWSRTFLAGMLTRGGPGAAPPLRAVLRDREASPAVRAVAADTLRSLNDIDSASIALELIEDEADRDVLAGCLRILKHLGHDGHLPVLRTMTSSMDPVVRSLAVSAIGALGTHDDVPLLAQMVDDRSFWVTLEAARGLRSLGGRDILEGLAAEGGSTSTLARQVLSE